MTVAGNRGKERSEPAFLSCHLTPPLQSFSPLTELHRGGKDGGNLDGFHPPEVHSRPLTAG